MSFNVREPGSSPTTTAHKTVAKFVQHLFWYKVSRGGLAVSVFSYETTGPCSSLGVAIFYG